MYFPSLSKGNCFCYLLKFVKIRRFKISKIAILIQVVLKCIDRLLGPGFPPTAVLYFRVISENACFSGVRHQVMN